MELILKGNPWQVSNRALILKPWTSSFRFDQGITHVPIWVNFPNLDLQFWSRNGHSKLASAVGKPLFADRYTALKGRINYARVLVEANVSSTLSMIVSIRDPLGNMLTHRIHHEWVPFYCHHCKRLGHKTESVAHLRREVSRSIIVHNQL